MQIVIDIPEEDYERLKVLKKAPACSLTSRVYVAIANGTIFNESPTIIEADKAEESDKESEE